MFVCPQLTDYRLEFSKWWVSEFKTVKYPAQGTIFDYYIDPETRKFMPWTEKVPKFELDPEVPLQVFPTSSVFCCGWSLGSPGWAGPRCRDAAGGTRQTRGFRWFCFTPGNPSESCELQLFSFKFRLACGFVDSHERTNYCLNAQNVP